MPGSSTRASARYRTTARNVQAQPSVLQPATVLRPQVEVAEALALAEVLGVGQQAAVAAAHVEDELVHRHVGRRVEDRLHAPVPGADRAA